MKKCALAVGLLGLTAAANAQVRITEFMYDSTTATIKVEYIEITNTGGSSVDLTGWSQDDSTRTPGAHMINFGTLGNTLAPGESALLIEDNPAVCNDAADFRTCWGLANTVKVFVYGQLDNIGRNDEINIYDCSGTLVDRLTYNDQTCGPRPKGRGVTAKFADLGFNLYCGGGGHSAWFFCDSNPIGFTAASTSCDGDTGTPGVYP